MSEQAPNPAPRFPVRLVVRIAFAAAVVVIVTLVLVGSPDRRTVSQVIDEIRGIALAKPQGGLIGPWWVSASGTDENSGRLTGFKLECGPIDIAAASARIIVNDHTNSFQFEMWDVVFARMAEHGEPTEENTVRQLDRYVLGPLPYPRDIVPDERRPALESVAIGAEKN